MRNYQEQYNKFVDENLDMCEQDNTKEELHQRVENLYDNLFEIIQNKYLCCRPVALFSRTCPASSVPTVSDLLQCHLLRLTGRRPRRRKEIR